MKQLNAPQQSLCPIGSNIDMAVRATRGLLRQSMLVGGTFSTAGPKSHKNVVAVWQIEVAVAGIAHSLVRGK